MTTDELQFPAIKQRLDAAASILMLSHEFTDGDDLGSMLALKFSLEGSGKRVLIAAYGGLPGNLIFLPGVAALRDQLPAQPCDLVIFFGCGDLARIGFDPAALPKVPTINIDHHPDNKRFAEINCVDPAAAATSELIFRLINFLRLPITKSVAVNLLCGIFSDTSGFRHANTTASVLEMAAELMRKGARIDRIADYYFGKSELPKLRAWARALENAQFDPVKKMVYSIVTERELDEIGAQPEDLEGIAEILNTVPEAKYALMLKQRGEEIKGSLRSENYKGVDVSQIARSFGGGGHKLAAGFKLKGSIEKTPNGWKIT